MIDKILDFLDEMLCFALEVASGRRCFVKIYVH